MSGAVLVAIAASIGNLLQGWDNATIAGKSRALRRSVLLYQAFHMLLLTLVSCSRGYISAGSLVPRELRLDVCLVLVIRSCVVVHTSRSASQNFR
jgi:hypothetical protein